MAQIYVVPQRNGICLSVNAYKNIISRFFGGVRVINIIMLYVGKEKKI